MKILFSPLVNENEKILYEFSDDLVKATLNNKTDVFNFRDLPDGELQVYDELGHSNVDTILDFQPIVSARRENGVLYLELINYIGLDASEEECFPEWIDHEDYKKEEKSEETETEEEKEGEDDGGDEVEE